MILRNERSRMPDAGIVTMVDMQGSTFTAPTCVVEIVFTHPRTLQEAHDHCQKYFDLAPSVRAVVLLRFGERDFVDRRFEAIGILYRRGDDGRPECHDAVSFGTAPISIKTLQNELPSPGVLRVFRALPELHLQPDRTLPAASPWEDHNPYISVPAADIFFLRDGVPGARPVMIPGTPNNAQPLRLDLYPIIRRIVRLDPLNEPTESRVNHPRFRVIRRRY
jgi:hypothetical protein